MAPSSSSGSDVRDARSHVCLAVSTWTDALVHSVLAVTTEKQGNQGGREKAVPWETIESLFKDVSLAFILLHDRAAKLLTDCCRASVLIPERIHPLCSQGLRSLHVS